MEENFVSPIMQGKPFLSWQMLKFFYTCPQGRVNRARYGLASLLLIIISLTLLIAIAVPLRQQGHSLVVAALIFSFYIVTLFFQFMLSIKRAHDFDYSGYICWAIFIPYVNILIFGFLFFHRGSIGPNKYGPDPLLSY